MIQGKLLLTLIFGIVVGFMTSQLLYLSNFNVVHDCSWSTRFLDVSIKNTLNEVAEYDNDESLSSYSYTTHQSIVAGVSSDELVRSTVDRGYAVDNASLASYLYDQTRVLCWVLTGPKNHETRAVHVKRTWGSRCNKLIFMSSVENKTLGAVKLSVGEGRGNLWKKTREALVYLYKHHLDDADWFMKADDDTYVIPENLRAFLYPYSTEAPVYFGCKFKPHVRQGYMSGGAGYVLSKEALRRFAQKAYPNSKICRQRSGGSEDKEIGFCLQNVGVVAGDSRDEQKRGRFFPSAPQGHIIPKDKTHWYWRYIFYATTDGINCCSDYAISFHYIQPNYFYLLDYLIYHLRPFGILHEPAELPPKQNMTELLLKWQNETSDNPL